MSPETRDLARAKQRAEERVEEDLHLQEIEKKAAYSLPQDIIRNPSSPEAADQLTASLNEAMRKDDRRYYLVGFDVEGTSDPKSYSAVKNFETFQTYTQVGEQKFAFVYQNKRIIQKKVHRTVWSWEKLCIWWKVLNKLYKFNECR